MSGGYRVSLEALDEVIARMTAFQQQFEAAHDEADQQARQLGATWTGAASDAHQTVHGRWSQGTGQMHAALMTMRSIAQTAHENYGAAVSTNSRMWAL